MNPMTNVKNIQKLNEQVLQQGLEDDHSWHRQYKDSAYIFIGGLPYDLTEGDLLCVFSQYGEIVNINLVRDKKTGKQKGFCFICYEDQRSTILAVDNFNGIKLGGRTIRVDHCSNYRRPLSDEKDEEGKRKEIMEEGCAPKTPSPSPPSSDNEEIVPRKKHKKEKKAKKLKKEKERKEIPDKHRTSVDKYERGDEKRIDKYTKDFNRDIHAKTKHEDKFDRQAHKVKTSSHSNHHYRKHYKRSDYDVQKKFNDKNSDGYFRDDRYSSQEKESHSSEYYNRKR